MNLLVLFLFLAVSASAQLQIPVENWRTHAGDDPKWADPALPDDAEWTPSRGPAALPVRATPAEQEWRWFRAVISIPDTWRGRDLAIATGPLWGAFEVYVEGVRIGQFGVLPPESVVYSGRHLWFAVPRELSGRPELRVALRTWRPRFPVRNFPMLVSGQFAQPHGVVAGLAESIGPAEQLHTLQGLRTVSFVVASRMVTLLAGLLALLLFAARPRQWEYCLLGVGLTWNGAATLTGAAAGHFDLPLGIPLSLFVSLSSSWGNDAITCLSLAAASPRRERMLALLSIGLFGTAVALNVAFLLANEGLYAGGRQLASLMAVGITGLALWRIPSYVAARKPDLALLAAATAFRAGYIAWIGAGLPSGAPMMGNQISVGFRDISSLAFALVIVAILLIRFLREERASADAAREFEAAQQVQTLLLSRFHTGTHGTFAIEAAWHSAKEVGGDFCWSRETTAEGGLLVAVGDVSGKGVGAALRVAEILGFLNAQQGESPGELLAGLNRALAGHMAGGFVTCCILRLDPGGRIVAASAGHPAPWLDGRELELDPSFPLGIVESAEWRDTTHEFPAGSRLLLVSDGVPEAANAKGELFGFERTAAMSAKPASEIAEAAQAWGQTDDITVVTLRRSVTA